MGSSENEIRELSTLVKETSDQIFEDHYSNFCDLLNRVELSECDCPVPLEVWTGIAQALADASGYRIVLQAGITEPVNDASNMLVFVNRWALPSGCPRCGAKLTNIELLGRGLTARTLPFLEVFGWKIDWAAYPLAWARHAPQSR